MTGLKNLIFIAVVYGLVGGSYWLVPALRSTGQYFGVTVAEGFRGSVEARQISRRYRWTLAAWVLVAVVIHLSAPTAAQWVPLAALLLLTAGATFAMVTARNAVLPHALAVRVIRTASLAPDENHIPGGLLTIVGPFVLLGVEAMYLNSRWETLPARFPTYYLAIGHPELWEDKSLQTVFGPLAMGALILLLAVAGMFAISQGTPAGPGSAGRFRRAALNAKAAGVWMVALIVVNNSLSHLVEKPLITLPVMAVVLMGVALLVSWPLFRVGLESGSGGEQVPASAWKLGILYYNPDDPALMVRRRFTMGYTLNFGNKLSWALVGLTAILVAAAGWLKP